MGRRFVGRGTAAVLAAVVLQMAAVPQTQARTSPVPASSLSGSPYAGCVSDSPSEQPGDLIENAEAEVSLAVNPLDPQHMVAAFIQDFWTAGVSDARGTAAAVTRDGGASWTHVPNTRTTLCAGGLLPRANDSWVAFGPKGDVYLSSLVTHWGFPFDTSVVVSRSSDGGETWAGPAVIHRDTNPNVLNDKPSVTADPHSPGYVYAVWSRDVVTEEKAVTGGLHASPNSLRGELGEHMPAWMGRSKDGGITWEPSRVLHDPGRLNATFANQIIALPGGRLVNLFTRAVAHRNDGGQRGFSVAVVRSDDRGSTWSDATEVSKMQPASTRDPLTGAAVTAGRFAPDVASQPNTEILYAVWQDARFGSGGRNAIVLSSSTDAGRTWVEPRRVGLTPRGTTAFNPAVTVDAGGAVSVAYYDWRNNAPDDDPGDPLETDWFVATCATPDVSASDACAGDWDEERVTPSSFDLRASPMLLGDYQGLVASGRKVTTAFTATGGPGDPSSIFAAGLGG